MTKLTLERKDRQDQTPTYGTPGGPTVSITPPIDEDYWEFRVRLSETQAIVGFPKFFTIGIGFAVEDDWNTNLPYTCTAEQIYDHIEHNKGDDAISREDCLEAIRIVQAAAGEARSPKGVSVDG